MRTMNQVLIQLYEANRLACAENPHHRRLAVVLLDNIVELQLVRQAKSELLFDHTTWYSGVRQYDHKARRNVERYHAQLLEFAQGEGWIDAEEVSLLSYAHRVRNDFYHRGNDDSLDAEIAIRLLYRLIRTRFPDWRTGEVLFEIVGGDTIDIASARDDASGKRPITFESIGCDDVVDAFDQNTETAWAIAIGHILSYAPNNDLREIIAARINIFLDETERFLNFINKNADVSFIDVLSYRFHILTPAFQQASLQGRKITDPNEAINFYIAILKVEEKLLDIADMNERATECHKTLDAYQPISQCLPRTKIAEYRKDAQAVNLGTEAEGIATFLRIEEELRTVSRAIQEFAMNIDGHINSMIDLARGK